MRLVPICIIAPTSLRNTPYLRNYEEVLDSVGMTYDVLFWDRFGTGETRSNARAYEREGTAGGWRLLSAYMGFRRFLLRHLAFQKYELFIVLGMQVGVLLYDFLRSRAFVLDVRDYSHEGRLAFRAAAFDLVRRARLVCISSLGFLEWLPHGIDYVMSHNLTRADLAREAAPFDRSLKVLSYVGLVRDFAANARFIAGAGGHRDWDVRYIGQGLCERQLADFCRARGIRNVSFQGSFRPEEKARFYDQANFVIGIYGADTPIVRTLTPNRLYESCLHQRPIIVDSGSYLAKLVQAKGVGAVIDLDRNAAWSSALDRYYSADHFEEYEENCHRFLEEVKVDMATFERRVQDVVGSPALSGGDTQ